jgi:hypothetical protein
MAYNSSMTSSATPIKSKKPRGATAKVLPGVYSDKMPAFSSAPLNAPTGKMKFATLRELATKAKDRGNAKVKDVRKALWTSSGKKITNETDRPIVQNPAQTGDKSKWHGGVSRVGTHNTVDSNRGMNTATNHVWTARPGQAVLNLSPNLPKKKSKAKPAPCLPLFGPRHLLWQASIQASLLPVTIPPASLARR